MMKTKLHPRETAKRDNDGKIALPVRWDRKKPDLCTFSSGLICIRLFNVRSLHKCNQRTALIRRTIRSVRFNIKCGPQKRRNWPVNADNVQTFSLAIFLWFFNHYLVRSQTHKRLKERFLIGRNRTERAQFRGSPLFQATYNRKTNKFFNLSCVS